MSDDASLAQAFRRFHAENPHVYDRLVKLTYRALRQGRYRLGMKMLFEVVRWEHLLTTDDPHGFKLNNNYTAFYARLIMESEPQLAGMFELRTQRSPKGTA